LIVLSVGNFQATDTVPPSPNGAFGGQGVILLDGGALVDVWVERSF
jgi:hypothetical protein